jgi:hypothetical protein
VRRLALLGAAVTLMLGAVPAAAAAEVCPPFDGSQSCAPIQSLEDPEDFCWVVNLHEDQELRQIDDRHAAVYWSDDPDERIAFTTEATAAHDSVGTLVPATLAVSNGNLITLTVHHRAGNFFDYGAPFVYPIQAGVPGGAYVVSHLIVMPPPEVNTNAPPAEQPPVPLCQVPSLRGKTVRGARRTLRRAYCSLGPVRGEFTPGARVVRQYQPAGKQLPEGTVVGVKLG